jgi:hypothetical protein
VVAVIRVDHQLLAGEARAFGAAAFDHGVPHWAEGAAIREFPR